MLSIICSFLVTPQAMFVAFCLFIPMGIMDKTKQRSLILEILIVLLTGKFIDLILNKCSYVFSSPSIFKISM